MLVSKGAWTAASSGGGEGKEIVPGRVGDDGPDWPFGMLDMLVDSRRGLDVDVFNGDVTGGGRGLVQRAE